MAPTVGIGLVAELQKALDEYRRGEKNLAELRSDIYRLLRRGQVRALFAALPEDAAVELIDWLKSNEGEVGEAKSAIQIGTFAPPKENRRQHFARASRLLLKHVTSREAWLDSIDLGRAVDNTRSDTYSDWYRDPWGWPELTFLKGEGRTHILARSLHGPQGFALSLDVPKNSTEHRPALLLDLTDRILYQACADAISPKVNQRLPDWVYGWRLPARHEGPGRYARLDYQWTNYVEKLHRDQMLYGCAFHADIANFFSSLSMSTIESAMSRISAGPAGEMALAIIRAADARANRSGLPQRSTASSVIANLILSHMDHSLERTRAKSHRQSERSIEAARWVDDIWIFGRQQGLLEDARATLSHQIGEMGLSLNSAKTGFFEGDALAQRIDRLGLSYIDVLLSQKPPDHRALEAAVGVVLAEPREASRHEISFIASRVKQLNRVDLAERLAGAPMRLAHGADYLAPVFKRFGIWRNLLSWYGSILNQDCLPWIKATYLRMWPLEEEPARDLIDRLAELSLSAAAASIVRIMAVSRLARWRPDLLRAIFDELVHEEVDPMLRRALGFGAVIAGEPRGRVKRFLLA